MQGLERKVLISKNAEASRHDRVGAASACAFARAFAFLGRHEMVQHPMVLSCRRNSGRKWCSRAGETGRLRLRILTLASGSDYESFRFLAHGISESPVLSHFDARRALHQQRQRQRQRPWTRCLQKSKARQRHIEKVWGQRAPHTSLALRREDAVTDRTPRRRQRVVHVERLHLG